MLPTTSRFALAHALEELGHSLAAGGNLSASAAAHFEASAVFQACSEILPGEPDLLLRQWLNGRRAREVTPLRVSLVLPHSSEELRLGHTYTRNGVERG